MTEIFVSRTGWDANGNSKFLYQFVDRENGVIPGSDVYRALQREFNCFGRVSGRGITSQCNPQEMSTWFNSFGANQSMTLFKRLGDAQKDIDRCNGHAGCNKQCSASTQSVCHRLRVHTACVSRMSYCREFLSASLVLLEKPLTA